MKVMCEFGIKSNGCIGARVDIRDNGRWNSVRCRKLCDRWAGIMKQALGVWATDERFRTEFSFFVEPHTVEGPLLDAVGTTWTDFARRPNCNPRVAECGYEVYQTILKATVKEA